MNRQSAARPGIRIFASSMGVSMLVPAGAKTLDVTVTWGDYEHSKRPRAGPAFRVSSV